MIERFVASLYWLSVILHLTAVMAWVGGMIFLVGVLLPAARQVAPDRWGALVGATGRRFRSLGWLCLGVLVATGVFNLYARGIGLAHLRSAEFWATAWGRVLAVKLVLVAAISAASAVHDFAVGPRAADALSPRRAAVVARWLGRATLLLALCTIVCGMMLVRGCPH